MEEIKKLLRWDVIVAIIATVASATSWYYATNQTNQIQNEKIAQHEVRIVQLEQKSIGYDTQLALIKLQLDTIQGILKDIQEDLKNK